MKTSIFAFAFVSMLSTPAFADRIGYITRVQPVYAIEYQTVNQPNCYQVSNPTYYEVGPSGGDIIAGAIVGGAIGNQFGNGSGKDVMTALGAILGAEAASNNRRVIVQNEVQTVCTNEYITQEVQVFDGYEVEYELNGKIKSFHTYERFSVGDRVIVR